MQEEDKKRVCARAIIIKDGKAYLMYRIKKVKEFYAFAGGGLEVGENIKECCVREVQEEFGIKVNCEKLLYTYVGKKKFELFYLCTYVSGEFGSGNGEEFISRRSDNVYLPKQVDVKVLQTLPIKPNCIKNALINDLANGNLYKCTNVQDFVEEDKKV